MIDWSFQAWYFMFAVTVFLIILMAPEE